MKTLLVLIIIVSGASAGARVANNTFIKGRTYAPLSSKPAPQPPALAPVKVEPKLATKPVVLPKAAPVVVPNVAPVVSQVVTEEIVAPIPLQRPVPKVETPAIPAIATPRLIAPVPVTMSPAIATSRVGNNDSSSDPGPFGATTAAPKDSEVVSTASAPETNHQAPATPTINDLPNCRYHADCWKNLNLSQEIKKVVANIRYVNDLHDTKIDPRYMLCTGYRESTFNPGAVSSSNAKGIFQVIPSTGKAALRIGSKLPGFSNKNWTQFAADMVHSSLAQTEISLLVLKMKVNEGASARTLKGTGSVADYTDLAWRYVGKTNTNYARSYRNHITNCFSCLRGISDANINNGEPSGTIKNCLQKAK